MKKKYLHIHWTEFINLAKGKSELYSKDNCKKYTRVYRDFIILEPFP